MKKILFILFLPFALAAQNQFPGVTTYTGQAAQTATVNNIIPATAGAAGTDVLGATFGSIQIQSTATGGQFIFESSNSDANYSTMPVWNNTSLTGTPITAAITPTVSNTTYYFPLTTRFIRVRISATITGGSIQALTRLTTQSANPVTFQVAQATAANLNATVTATNLSTNVAQIGGTATVNGGVAGTLGVGGNIAHSGASTANPLQAGGRVVPTTIATVDQTLVAGDVGYKPLTTGNQAIIKPFGTAELDYTFNWSTVGTTTTVQQLVPASGTAGVRNYVASITLHSDAMGAAGVFWILDGALTVSSIAITTGLVTTSSAHDLKVGDAVVFTALAAGTGVSTNTVYYVTSVGSTTTFNFSTAVGGSNVVPSVAYTGTTMYRILYQQALRTAGIDRPMTVTFNTPTRGIANAALNFLIPVSMTSGNIYVTMDGYRGF